MCSRLLLLLAAASALAPIKPRADLGKESKDWATESKAAWAADSREASARRQWASAGGVDAVEDETLLRWRRTLRLDLATQFAVGAAAAAALTAAAAQDAPVSGAFAGGIAAGCLDALVSDLFATEEQRGEGAAWLRILGSGPTAVAALSLAPAVFEEALFRGPLLWTGSGLLAPLASAALFAAVHAPNGPRAGLSHLKSGLVYASLLVCAHSLAAPVAAHAAHNAVVAALLLRRANATSDGRRATSADAPHGDG
ncbi:hypothetical protein M885DRAFT_505125 [Pelagophyceae sp. CCMP2097]|nr:hypothetical protein M885DRAFT_505125 [Pelagophyceae sp. CCMP2097]